MTLFSNLISTDLFELDELIAEASYIVIRQLQRLSGDQFRQPLYDESCEMLIGLPMRPPILAAQYDSVAKACIDADAAHVAYPQITTWYSRDNASSPLPNPSYYYLANLRTVEDGWGHLLQEYRNGECSHDDPRIELLLHSRVAWYLRTAFDEKISELPDRFQFRRIFAPRAHSARIYTSRGV